MILYIATFTQQDETKITRLKDISDHVWKDTKPTC